MDKENILIELHKTYQESHLAIYHQFWNSFKFYLTLVSVLFSVQFGLYFQFGYHQYIIPFGVIGLLIISYINARKEYKSIMQYLTSLAKIEDELSDSLTRKANNRMFFPDSDSILYSGWIEGRKKFKNKIIKTDQDFIKENLKRNCSALGLVKWTLISIGILDVILIFYIFKIIPM